MRPARTRNRLFELQQRLFNNKMRKGILHIAIVLSCSTLSCERVVDIQKTTPQPVVYCDLDPGLEGSWFSDSVHIETRVDTIDSVIINHLPTLTYDLVMDCSDTSLFVLSYTNFAGVRTEDVNAVNFSARGGQVYVFNTFDDAADTATAGFHMRYQLSNDSVGVFRFQQQPNPGQTTNYTLFLKKAS